MTMVLEKIGDRITALGSNWTSYTVLGSFVLYVVGYLTLRFHLTAIGIGTDLAVLDERYLFTGARFLVYLVSSVPSILIVALPFVLVAWAAGRVVPESTKSRAHAWLMDSTRLTIFGVVFSVIVIQTVMRQCFVFSDLLLARELPRTPAWLVRLLVDGTLMPIYFSAIVALTIVPIAILFAVRDLPAAGAAAMARGLLVFLAAVQVLLLPINYGVLIVDKTMPRIAAIGDERPLVAGEQAWLVWEGKEGVTFLVRTPAEHRRSLITFRRDDVPQTEILGFDPILPTIFGDPQ
jgi:hypothetical protein